MRANDRYAVIGDPIGHSLSPAMQSAAFRAAGFDASYEAVRVESGDLAAWFHAMRAGVYRGCNVTIPHKEDVPSLLDDVSPQVEQTGAVNTVLNVDGTLNGHNTDIPGFRAAADALLEGTDLVLLDAVVFGAGGSARAVLAALTEMAVSVTIVNRSEERALALLRTLPDSVTHLHRVAPDDIGAREAIASAALLVNTTPLGMAHLPDGDPLPAGSDLSHRPAAIDLVYGRETPFLRRTRAAGCPTQDGIEMLVQQGACSFSLWTGEVADKDAMRSACYQELEGRRRCYAS